MLPTAPFPASLKVFQSFPSLQLATSILTSLSPAAHPFSFTEKRKTVSQKGTSHVPALQQTSLSHQCPQPLLFVPTAVDKLCTPASVSSSLCGTPTPPILMNVSKKTCCFHVRYPFSSLNNSISLILNNFHYHNHHTNIL